MEVYAGFGEYTDHEIGRLIDAIEDTGQLDNTLIFYIVGDNGTSAEGGMNGMFNEMTYFNGVPETVPDMLKHYDEWGGPSTYPHMAAGWAVAGDTPFTWTKQVPSDYGGTRNGMVVHWPKGIKAKGEVRSQWHHVIDVAPTVLEAAGLPEPKSVNGTSQTPIEGVSMVYTFDDAKAPGPAQDPVLRDLRQPRHLSRRLVRRHHPPSRHGKQMPRRPLHEDIWELYDTRKDFSLANDLAAQNPAKLKELQALFLKEAAKYRVLPHRRPRRSSASTPRSAGRPDLMGGRTSLTVYEGMKGMTENVFINIKNRSHTITAEVEIPDGRRERRDPGPGAGASAAGACTSRTASRPTPTTGSACSDTRSPRPKPLAAGKATIRFEFAYDGGGLGKGGTATIFVNGKKVAERPDRAHQRQ